MIVDFLKGEPAMFKTKMEKIPRGWGEDQTKKVGNLPTFFYGPKDLGNQIVVVRTETCP